MLTWVIAKLVLTMLGTIFSRRKETIILGNSEKNVCVGLSQVVCGFDAGDLIQLRRIYCQILPHR